MSNLLLKNFANERQWLLGLLSIVMGATHVRAAMPATLVTVESVFREDEVPVTTPLSRLEWLNSTRSSDPVIRGQNGTYDPAPLSPTRGSPYQPQDPFQAGPDPALPYVNDPGPTVLSGINGPQPHRFGFTPFFDGTYIGSAGAKKPGQGQFEVQEYNAALKHVSLIAPDWVFTNTAQGGVRLWDGPNKPNLPGAVYHLGWDFTLNTPQVGSWSGQVGFNPSINTDFNGGLSRDALNLDGNATLFYRASPQLLFVLGAQYWDRVENIIIPNAGVVWNPNDRLELRLLFPKSRISYFVGNFGAASHWLYATGEYHVESFQYHTSGALGREQIQISDYRVGVGLRSDHQWYDKYIEVGYVFQREAKFLHATPGFNIGDGFMARFGVRF